MKTNDYGSGSSSSSSPTLQQIKTMDYSEALLDFNFTKAAAATTTASNDSSHLMESFSHQLFELNNLTTGIGGGGGGGGGGSTSTISNGSDFNSTVLQVVLDSYDSATPLSSATLLSADGVVTAFPTITTFAAVALAEGDTNTDANGGLVIDTLLGSVMTTATATVTSAATSYQENFYETTAISSITTMKSPGNESAYWELEASDFDFLYRHSLAMTIVYCIAYVIVFLVGLVGNSFVIAVVLRMRNMRTVTNYFIVNLAIADILVIVFCLPATLMSNIFVRKYSTMEIVCMYVYVVFYGYFYYNIFVWLLYVFGCMLVLTL